MRVQFDTPFANGVAQLPPSPPVQWNVPVESPSVSFSAVSETLKSNVRPIGMAPLSVPNLRRAPARPPCAVASV